MRNLIILFCFLLLAIAINAQKKYNDEGKWAATLTGAIIPLPKVNIGLQPGIQFYINDRVSVLNEVTIRIGKNDASDSSAFDKKYFRIQPELRYSFYGKSTRFHSYLGLRLSFAGRKYFNIKGGHYLEKSSDDTAIYYNSAKINSPIKTISIQYGIILFENKLFSADMFIGVGARFIRTSFSDVKNPIRGIVGRPIDGLQQTSPTNCNYPVSRGQINGGLRLIYYFSK